MVMMLCWCFWGLPVFCLSVLLSCSWGASVSQRCLQVETWSPTTCAAGGTTSKPGSTFRAPEDCGKSPSCNGGLQPPMLIGVPALFPIFLCLLGCWTSACIYISEVASLTVLLAWALSRILVSKVSCLSCCLVFQAVCLAFVFLQAGYACWTALVAPSITGLPLADAAAGAVAVAAAEDVGPDGAAGKANCCCAGTAGGGIATGSADKASIWDGAVAFALAFDFGLGLCSGSLCLGGSSSNVLLWGHLGQGGTLTKTSLSSCSLESWSLRRLRMRKHASHTFIQFAFGLQVLCLPQASPSHAESSSLQWQSHQHQRQVCDTHNKKWACWS